MNKPKIELSPFEVILIGECCGISNSQIYADRERDKPREPIDYTIQKIAEGMLPEKGSLYWRN